MVIIVNHCIDIVGRHFKVGRFILGNITERRESGMSLLFSHFIDFIRKEVRLIIVHFRREFLSQPD
jgi:hypothetical protein